MDTARQRHCFCPPDRAASTISMLDLLVTHATLPDGASDMSIAVQDGRIVEVAPGLQAPAHETLDAGGLQSARPSSIRTSTWTPR
jgi:hypothetical protein